LEDFTGLKNSSSKPWWAVFILARDQKNKTIAQHLK